MLLKIFKESIKDLNGTIYEQEIQKISESTEPIYRIEKIVKKRKRKTIQNITSSSLVILINLILG
jgi:hypothetical protein